MSRPEDSAGVNDQPRTKRPAHRPEGSKSHNNGNKFKKCTCPRRKWAKCPHPWHVTIRRGRLYRGSLNKLFGKPTGYRMSETEADTYVHQLIVQIVAKQSPWHVGAKAASSPPDTRMTVAELFRRYVEQFSNDPNRRKHRAKRLEKQTDLICRTPLVLGRGARMAFGDIALADVTTATIEAWRDGRRETMRQKQQERDDRMARLATGDTKARAIPVSPERPRARNGEVGINRHLEVVRHVMNFAIRKGFYERENPFLLRGQRVIDFAKEKSRSRRLQPGEQERLEAAAAAVPHLQALIIAAIETGGRRRELLTLQWRDVRFDSRNAPTHIVIRAENSKTDVERSIPVSLRLRAVLDMRRDGPDGEPHGPEAHVFGNEVGEKFDSVKTAWRSACRKASITGLTFHDLRREFGSRLLEGGVNLLAVSKLLGHRSITTTNTYLKADASHVEQEVKQFHQRQAAALAPPAKRRAGRRGATAAARPH